MPERARFADVVHALRTPEQFETARMQLALAHRFARIGALDIELEPTADAGRRADLFFRYAGRPHLVECYEPAPKRNAHFDDLLHGGRDRILDVAADARRRVIVRIDLRDDHRSMDASLRKRIEQEAQHLIRSLKPPQGCERKSLSAFDVEVLDTEGISQEDAQALVRDMALPDAWIQAPALVRQSEMKLIPRGVDVRKAYRGWLVVNRQQTEPADAMQRLAEAIEQKLPQVRRASDGALGIMVAITGPA